MIPPTNHFFDNYVEPDSITRIWRCFTFDHFIDELDKESLFFSRASNVSDPSDSQIPEFDLKMENQVTNYLRNFYGKDYELATGEPEKDREEFRRRLRENTVINCWRMDEIDSPEMWSEYKSKPIAVSSSIGRLKESLNDHRFPLTYRKVDYLDTVKEGMGRDWILNAQFFTKKKKFSWEKEFRVVVAENYKYSNQEPYQIGDRGLYVDVNFDKLISAIHIEPHSKISTKEIEEILLNHDITKNVVKTV